MRRKAAGTLKVVATGRASHSGSAPDHGRNALLALPQTATTVADLHDPSGPQRLSVVPTVMRSGDAFNVVPAAGELIFDVRARGLQAFDDVLARITPELDGVKLDARMERLWPGMDSEAATAELLAGAGRRLGRPIVGVRARRRERREPLRGHDRADGRRARAPGRRRAHARRVRPQRVAARARRGGARRGPAGARVRVRSGSRRTGGRVGRHVPSFDT